MSAHGPDFLLLTRESVQERSDFSPFRHVPEFRILYFHHLLPHERSSSVLDVVAPFSLFLLLPLSLLRVSNPSDPPLLVTVLQKVVYWSGGSGGYSKRHKIWRHLLGVLQHFRLSCPGVFVVNLTKLYVEPQT